MESPVGFDSLTSPSAWSCANGPIRSNEVWIQAEMAVDSGAGCRQINVYRGRATSNVVPDSAVEVTPISPPCAVTMARAMNKPKPKLRGLSDVPRLSGSKIVARACDGIGSPLL